MLKPTLRTNIAVLMALSLGTSSIAPLVMLERPAVAGIFSQSNSVSQRNPVRGGDVFSGTRIRVEEQDGKKIVIGPDENLAATLVTVEPVRSDRGTILIPRGTQIEGEFRPARDREGTQFFARRIIFRDGTERNLDASSNVINTRKRIRKGVNIDPIWQGAIVGGGASAIISSIVSDVGIFKVLGGAGAGALAGWLLAGRKKTEVIVVDPAVESLELTLDSDLLLSSR
ncbi:MAG: hypothetical protein MH252_10480 [Thermosynechococcaceae cyanobacterium MS004]|nr:hypothetical protein [Thermosynechococcaceae cyanobacterium MS004]